jgi:hypothetical protein
MRVSGCRYLAINGNVVDSYGRNKEREGGLARIMYR